MTMLKKLSEMAGDMAFNAYFTSSSRRVTARSPGLPSIIRGS